MNVVKRFNVNNTPVTLGTDDEPTAGSDNLVKSEGVYDYFNKVTMFPFTNNQKLNKIIKELYLTLITESDLGNVTLIRLYNGYYSSISKNYIYGLQIYITNIQGTALTIESETQLSTLPSYIVSPNKRHRSIVDLTQIAQGSYVDFLNPIIKPISLDEYYSPRISLILFKERGGITNSLDISDNPLMKNAVKELYMPASAVARVKKARIYNGYNENYSLILYDENNTVIRQAVTTQGGVIAKSTNGDTIAVINLDVASSGNYRDYDNISLNPCVGNINYWPIIYRIKNTLQLKDNFKATDNDEVNNIIKELSIPQSLVSRVSKINILNNHNSRYEIQLLDSSSAMLRTLYKTDKGIFYLSQNNDSLAVVDMTNAVSGFSNYSITLNNSVGNIEYWPNIYRFRFDKINYFYPTNSSDVNNIIKELYIPSSLVERVAKIRIYNGYNSNYSIMLYDSNDAEVRTLYRTSDNYAFRSQNGDSTAIADLSKAPQDYSTYITTLHLCTGNLNYWPLITSYLNNIYENYFKKLGLSAEVKQNVKPLVYEADDKVNSGYICNAVAYPNGVAIVARANGNVCRLNLDGTETTLLSISGTMVEWRCLYMDNNLNVYASPHGKMSNMTDRGLYRLKYGENQFVKVISLFDTSSSIETETQQNDDTIWTMCEDADGYLYAGVYAHTKRPNASVYRSSDGGETWECLTNLLTILPSGRHIHCIIYNKFDNALYAIVGEINTILKSVNKGVTWINLYKQCEGDKGTAIIDTPNGLIIGSDTAYSMIMSKLYSNNSLKTKGKIWANAVFGIKRSDVTGWLYAFGKIDSSINLLDYMPPVQAINDSSVLESWKNGTYGSMTAAPKHLTEWEEYNKITNILYKDDSIRPQHFAILRSMDEGETWEVIYKDRTLGAYCVGNFFNGECLCSRSNSNGFIRPIVISENKHKYTQSGIDLSGEILIRTNTNNYV